MNYLDPQVLKKISRLEVRARHIVEGFISGLHKSPYHGYSVEFASHREYVPGDEIKHIDWKVWARGDRYYIKQYEEETNLKCTFLVDCSKSMRYGEDTDHMSKFDCASTIAASLAFLLQRQQDSCGLVLFDNDIRLQLNPSSHPSQVRQVVHELDKAEPDDKTDVSKVFLHLAELIHRRGMVILLSDLFCDYDDLKKALQRFRLCKHEVLLFHILHEDELVFPFRDNTLFKGLEVDTELMIEPRGLRNAYLERMNEFLQKTRRLCANLDVDYVQVNTKEHLDAALARYLAFRQGGSKSVTARR